jgi:hypothetical protein
MKIALEGNGLAVFDDVLDPAQFAAVNRLVEASDFHSVHRRGWNPAWRLWDGAPLRGAPVYYDPAGVHGSKGASYPTTTGLDAVIDAIRRVVATRPRVAGTEGTDWTAMFLSPWLYPVGSALSLHLDGGAYSGAFTYFVHTRWSLHWGGELLVLPPRATTPSGSPRGHAERWLSEEDDLDAQAGAGLATCVFPRPNRLVLVGPDRPHMIRRVDTNAGAHARASLAGFFLRS